VSRIRSIHPGLWTDEAFVGLSPMARLFLLGLWNECDDMGSFAWSPLGLKMRILPADTVDASELLGECVQAGVVKRYEVGGKPFGAVRNFCQYQRPKKPNSIHPQTEEVRKWVNIEARSTRDGSEPVTHQSGTDGEKCRQREDGGDKGIVDTVSSETVPDPDVSPEDFVEAWNAMADTCALPKARLTPERRKKIRTLVKRRPLEEIREAIWRVPRSPFLCGEGPRGWRANIDFILQPSSFQKLIEGSYEQQAA
jgi:hypothetical protein